MPYGSAGSDALPVLNSRFRVEIDSIQFQAFGSAKRDGGEFGTYKHRTGIDPPEMKEARGMRSPWEITLTLLEKEGGKDSLLELISWCEAGDRRSVAIIILDSDGNEARRESWRSAMVKKHEMGELKATDEDTPIEHTFTLTANEWSTE